MTEELTLEEAVEHRFHEQGMMGTVVDRDDVEEFVSKVLAGWRQTAEENDALRNRNAELERGANGGDFQTFGMPFDISQFRSSSERSEFSTGAPVEPEKDAAVSTSKPEVETEQSWSSFPSGGDFFEKRRRERERQQQAEEAEARGDDENTESTAASVDGDVNAMLAEAARLISRAQSALLK